MDGNIYKEEKNTTQYHFYFIEAFVSFGVFFTLSVRSSERKDGE